MKINLGKLLATVGKAAKNNPEIALAVTGLVAPKLVKRAAPLVPIILAAAVKR